MKVLILCGGKGTRIREHAKGLPKPLLTVGDIPIVEHVMSIYAAQGFDDFILLTGFGSKEIEKRFSNGHPKWNVEPIFTGVETNKGDRIKMVKDKLGKRFCVTYSDGVSDIDIKELVKFHEKNNFTGTITTVNLPSPYGIVEIEDNGQISRFKEKPTLQDYWINAGFMVFEKRALENWTGDLETEVLVKMAKNKELGAYKHKGFWESMDTYKDYQQLNTIWKQKGRWA